MPEGSIGLQCWLGRTSGLILMTHPMSLDPGTSDVSLLAMETALSPSSPRWMTTAWTSWTGIVQLGGIHSAHGGVKLTEWCVPVELCFDFDWCLADMKLFSFMKCFQILIVEICWTIFGCSVSRPHFAGQDATFQSFIAHQCGEGLLMRVVMVMTTIMSWGCWLWWCGMAANSLTSEWGRPASRLFWVDC